MKINKAWLDSHEWMLRSSDNGVSYGDYRWKRKGAWNKAPDWNDKAKCGGGFHGIAPEAHGYGFDYLRIELHETRGKRVIINKNKIKVPKSRIVAVGSEIPMIAFSRCGMHVISDGDKINCVNDGIWIVLHGSATIKTVTNGGEMYSCGDSKIIIGTVGNDGYVRSYNNSEITIETVAKDGYVYACDSSKMAIETVIKDGHVRSYGDSKMTIENIINYGYACACGNSKMTIETVANGGFVYCYSDSEVTIETIAKGGKVHFCGDSKMTIETVTEGGEVHSYENSETTIKNTTGGYIHSCSKYPIKIINDLRKEKQNEDKQSMVRQSRMDVEIE